MQIFIKTLTGRKQDFSFEPTDTVLRVKECLREKEGIDVEQIRLIYQGRQLADDKKLTDFRIEAGSVVHMVLQLRGGSTF